MLALVCRSTHSLVTPILYRSVTLRDFCSIKYFARTLLDEAKLGRLAGLVQQLWIGACDRRDTEDCDRYRKLSKEWAIPTILPILRLCTSLHNLAIIGEAPRDRAEDIREAIPPSVERLLLALQPNETVGKLVTERRIMDVAVLVHTQDLAQQRIKITAPQYHILRTIYTCWEDFNRVVLATPGCERADSRLGELGGAHLVLYGETFPADCHCTTGPTIYRKQGARLNGSSWHEMLYRPLDEGEDMLAILHREWKMG
ncbi:hypothetical protein OE88DRAFT_1659781 [Heliocybe sulcata]|uniref:Uncharacterized protein n=1 Tax=Heliocybe sulcata TaxID=5364 RepID=A0A5C3N131_9AGAM|nr:hypothetical protein OE88DRAFT_1659781 [Heliocybe sulcata]